jgi:hypothetical protein
MLVGAAVVLLSGSASAGSLADKFNACVAKFAYPTVEATVTLECNAGGGKLTDCKVVEAPNPARGFDKAAMCAADAIPVGERSGTIRFPIKFEPHSS